MAIGWHTRPVPLRRRILAATGLGLVVTAVVAGVAGPAAADNYARFSGAGSTWSSNALDQWRSNVRQYGLTVDYAASGSSDGRNQFRNGTVDFAVTEIPYGLKDSGVVDTPPTRKYAYMPIVAGGTSFMYNLKIAGQMVTNLRLSGDVIAKIFTGVITNWGDPEIAADNPGITLPARRIVPVVRSDGSGTTAQFTSWMASQHQSLWDAYCAKAGRQTPCGATSNYPTIPGGGFTSQSGSLGVSGYVAQSYSEGAITYVEYSYALNDHFPVAKVLNNAGYYTEPTASNVAVALLQARINSDASSASYLTSDLSGVYRNGDKRAYPLSSYSYMVVPGDTTSNFSTEKGKALGAFAYYFLCQGQQQASVLGYSPLPINLVQGGLDVVKRIPGVAVESIDIRKCNNPTFSPDGTNTLARDAPQPPACDQSGQQQCATGTGGATASTPTRSGAGGTTTGAGQGGATGGSATSGVGVSGTSAGGATTGTSGIPVVANGTLGGTGQIPSGVSGPAGSLAGGTTIGADGESGTLGSSGLSQQAAAFTGQPTAATPVILDGASGWGAQQALMIFAGLLLVGLTVGPPILTRRLEGRP